MQLRGSKTKTKVVGTSRPKKAQVKPIATTSTSAQDVQPRRSSRQRKVVDYNLRSLEMASLTSQHAVKFEEESKKAEKRVSYRLFYLIAILEN